MLYKFPVLISSYDDDDVDDVDGDDGHDDVDVDGDDGADDGVGGADGDDGDDDGDDGDDDGGDDGDCSAVHWEVGRATRKTLPPLPLPGTSWELWCRSYHRRRRRCRCISDFINFIAIFLWICPWCSLTTYINVQCISLIILIWFHQIISTVFHLVLTNSLVCKHWVIKPWLCGFST